MHKPKLLIFTINPLHNAPRVIREIECLRKDYNIVVTGETAIIEGTIEYVNSNHIRLSQLEYTLGKVYRVFSFGKVFKGRYFTIQKKINALLDAVNPDLVIVHPGAYLPYFFDNKRDFKIVFNAHEFHPKEFEADAHWKNTWGRIFDDIYKKYLHKVDLLVNVCDGIAKECEKQYGKQSIVIPNASPHYDHIQPNLKSSGSIKMIHHGVAIKQRKLEIMIELAAKLGDGFELDLMLVYQDVEYYNYLQKRADQTKNVRLIPAVKFDDIIPFIHQYDLGLFLLPPVNFNYLHALPNKFFEFIQARLAIAIGPSPEMAQLVNKYELGIVSEDFSVESLFQHLQHLTHDSINKYKIASDRVAPILSAEQYNMLYTKSILNLIA